MSVAGTTEFPFLPKAPIVEAVIEFRAVFNTPWDANALANELAKRLPDYPNIKIVGLTEVVTNFSNSPTEPVTSESKHQPDFGIQLGSGDGSLLAFFSINSLRFSWLQNYPGWDCFIEEAKRMFSIFKELGRPTTFQRLGIRFINRIPIPYADDLSMKDYFTEIPILIQNNKWPVTGFFYHMTFTVPDSTLGVQMIVTTAQIVRDPPQLPVIVDLDVFKDSPSFDNEGELEALLSSMRVAKNTAFFNTITPKTIDLFR